MASYKDEEQGRKEQDELRIKELELEVNQLKSSLQKKPVGTSCDHEEEINQLQVSLTVIFWRNKLIVWSVDGVGPNQTKQL